MNKVAFGRSWKCRQALSPLCRNQWASGLRLPQPHQANGAASPPLRSGPSLWLPDRSSGTTDWLLGWSACCQLPTHPAAVHSGRPCAHSVLCLMTAAWCIPVMVSLGRSKCGGVGVPRPLSPNPMDTLSPAATHPAQLPLFLVLVTGCSWSSLGVPSCSLALLWAIGWGYSPRPPVLPRWWRWSRTRPEASASQGQAGRRGGCWSGKASRWGSVWAEGQLTLARADIQGTRGTWFSLTGGRESGQGWAERLIGWGVPGGSFGGLPAPSDESFSLCPCAHTGWLRAGPEGWRPGPAHPLHRQPPWGETVWSGGFQELSPKPEAAGWGMLQPQGC